MVSCRNLTIHISADSHGLVFAPHINGFQNLIFLYSIDRYLKDTYFYKQHAVDGSEAFGYLMFWECISSVRSL